MNRVFQARIQGRQYLFVGLLTVCVVLAMWYKHPILALIAMVVLVVSIEQLIHTSYIVRADRHLELRFGRFQKKVIIPFSDIEVLQKARRIRFKSSFFPYRHGVVIVYGGKKTEVIFPVREDEFVEVMTRKLSETNQSIKTEI